MISIREEKAMRVPSALIEGLLVAWPNPPVVLVTCVNVPGLVQRKISSLPSALPGLPGVRSAVETKAIRVPSALIEGPKAPSSTDVSVI